jgi:small subunit ribosomal protein S8e
MGISRDSRHKRRLTGGRMPIHKKKRLYESGRPPASTRLSDDKVIRRIRVRGGNYKFRALRLSTGNFTWASENCGRKTKVLDVVYNATNNELVRTKTLVKNCIVVIDATPFKQFFLRHYWGKSYPSHLPSILIIIYSCLHAILKW